MSQNQPQPATYTAAGVDTDRAENALSGLLGWLNKTFLFPTPSGRPVLENGFFANVHDLGSGLGVAISTDGVGTKLLVAQQMDRYDTVGIDCVAVNVNDVLCVGARPIALVDYLAVQQVDAAVLDQLGAGLYEGARQAGVAIASGELAQIPELLRGDPPGAGFDIAGACIGIVPLSSIIDGRAVQDGEAVVGFRSSGLHSNGYTLARRVLRASEKLALDSRVDGLDGTLGEELLKPTLIYVRPILDALSRTDGVTGLAHITGDGFLNLLRLRTDCGFELTALPEPPPIFQLIQKAGSIAPEEMYRVFNMGIGFCAVARPEAVSLLLDAAQRHGFDAQVIGHARRELSGKVVLARAGSVGEKRSFKRTG